MCVIRLSALIVACVMIPTLLAQTQSVQEKNVSDKSPEEKTDSVYDELEELVVVADRPIVSVSDGKVNYNVEEDPSAAGSNVLDMLRKVPMVNVDGEGNISINGANGYKIQVDGKDYPGISDYASTFLKSMPAVSVVRIEVITEPGVKEDAEGASAIINIITQKKQSQDGYNANLSLSLGRQSNALSGLVRMKIGKITGSVNAVYSTNEPFGSTNETWSDNEFFREGEKEPYGCSSVFMKQKSRYHYAQAGFDMAYEPNNDNLITANFKFDKILPKTDLIEMTNNIYSGISPLSFSRDVKADINYSNIGTGVSYQHNFGDKHYFVASYQFSLGMSGMDLLSDYHYDYPSEAAPFTRNGTFNYNRENTFQADYSLPLGEIHKIDVGAKAILRNNTAYGKSYEGVASDELVPSPDKNTDVSQRQDIGTVYAAYTAMLGDFSANAGIRYEHSHSSIMDRMSGSERFSKRMNDFVPSVTFNWNISPVSSLRLHYSQSINRPTVNELNPFSGIELTGITMMGNPNLKSQKNHKVSLSYSNFGPTIGASLSLQYARSNGMISPVVGIYDGKTIYQPHNIGHSQTPELNVMLNYNIIPRMRLTISGRVAYIDIAGAGYSNHGWLGGINGNWSYMLLSGFSFNAYGGYNSRQIALQSINGAHYYYGVSASKTFLSDKSLTLSINAGNFLQDRQTISSETVSRNNRLYRSMKFQSWNAGISLSWNFGSITGLNDKKTSTAISNDDVNNTAPSTSF